MNCCYRCCPCYWLETESAALVQDATATITVADTSLSNKCTYDMCYCVKFTDATGAEALLVTVGAVTLPVWDRDGEPVKIGRLCRGERLRLKYTSTGTAHFTLENCTHTLHLKTPEIAAATGA